MRRTAVTMFALLAVALAAVAACSAGGGGGGGAPAAPTGTVSVLLTDEFTVQLCDGVVIEDLNVSISSIDLIEVGGAVVNLFDAQTSGQGSIAVDVLDQNGTSTLLTAVGGVPAGDYRAIRMTIDTTQPLANHVVDTAGNTIPITVPTPPDVTVVFTPFVRVDPARPLLLLLDFVPDRSLACPQPYTLAPFIRAIPIPPALGQRIHDVPGRVALLDCPASRLTIRFGLGAGGAHHARAGFAPTLQVQLAPGTVFEDALGRPLPCGAQEFPVGTPVLVHGSLDADGVIQADRVTRVRDHRPIAVILHGLVENLQHQAGSPDATFVLRTLRNGQAVRVGVSVDASTRIIDARGLLRPPTPATADDLADGQVVDVGGLIVGFPNGVPLVRAAVVRIDR